MVSGPISEQYPSGYGSTHEKVGTLVTFVDSQGRSRDALLTAVWNGDNTQPQYQFPNCSVNLVMVSADPKEEDTYGRQIERSTSVPHKGGQTAPGNYWMEK